MMVVMSLTTLVANLFIELNKIKTVRKIYFEQIYNFDNILRDEITLEGYKYYSNFNSIYFYELKHGYSMFFDVYEDEIGYVVKLKENVRIEDLEECFRKNINSIQNEKILLNTLEKIDFVNEFLNKNKCK